MRIKRFFKYFGIAVAILVGSFLVSGQIAYHSVPIIDPPGKMYTVDGTKIHMYCTGPENNAQPTIIIISGGGTPSYVYDSLRENLSETIRTCSYDIPGFGWSEPNDAPSNVKNMSDELYRLLQVAQIDGPIILAGHSMGGLVSLIYSAEHEEQVAGIAFIDSSHYNQVGIYGKEFSDLSDRQTEEFLANFWLMELGSRLGIMNLMNIIFASSDSEQHSEDHKVSASLDRWNPPYAGMKSVISNFKLSLEQAKEAHYDRDDLPIISISASDIPLGGENPLGFSDQDVIDSYRFIHKDLADLSSNGRHVIINETDHISIVYNDETAEHILSLIPSINGK
ncbi:MAG: alpha/beta hydrolase [Nitrosopumilus sp.]